jgi:hypothetical protein
MAFISIRILFFSDFEWADLICLSGVGQPKFFFVMMYVIKSVYFNSFLRLSEKEKTKVGERSE